MLSVPHAPRLDDRNIPRKKSTFTSRRVAPSRSFSRTQPARVLTPLDPLGGPFAFFVFCLLGGGKIPKGQKKRTHQSTDLSFAFWKRMEKVLKKSKTKSKKENVKTDRRDRERTKSDRHQSRFVTFQILEEDVSVSRTSSRSQIADRRSARVHPLTKKLSE